MARLCACGAMVNVDYTGKILRGEREGLDVRIFEDESGWKVFVVVVLDSIQNYRADANESLKILLSLQDWRRTRARSSVRANRFRHQSLLLRSNDFLSQT